MPTIFDVAKYITNKVGEISAMKLQKLMYYSQAWHLVWLERPLFADDFEAWANGPVLPALYGRHRGLFKVDASLFDEANTTAIEAPSAECIDKVLAFYGDKTAQWLSGLTHREAPWLEARGELAPGESCRRVIPQASMHEYYSSL